MQKYIQELIDDPKFMESLTTQIIQRMVYLRHDLATMPPNQQRMYCGYILIELFKEAFGIQTDEEETY